MKFLVVTEKAEELTEKTLRKLERRGKGLIVEERGKILMKIKGNIDLETLRRKFL